MTLDDLCRAFISARLDDRVTRKRSVTEARGLLSTATDADWQKLSEWLADDRRKWFVAAVFEQFPVPERLMYALIRAAVYEVNPSFNKQFVVPCIASYGHRVVNEALLEVIKTGNDFEKAGAVNALYWAGMLLGTPQSRAAYLELEDVWERKRCLLLREFVTNENVNVRRSIIPSLKLDQAAYPDDLKPLVTKAIEIARSHPDKYI